MAAGAGGHAVRVPMLSTERSQRQAGYHASEGAATGPCPGRVPPPQHYPH